MLDLAGVPFEDRFVESFKNPEELERVLVDAMVHVAGVDPARAGPRDWFYVLAHVLRSALSVRTVRTARRNYDKDVKRVYYLSMEYLMGRSLAKVLIDLDVMDSTVKALERLGLSFAEIEEMEFDAGLGNGGLGRLAACFLDSLATHDYPSIGYGIRYEYGMFRQQIENGQQVEQPENWLRFGNPWEIERPTVQYPVRFGGRILSYRNAQGQRESQWADAQEVMAMAFDMPVSGFNSESVGNLRLWSARSTQEFDLGSFNEGHYVEAVGQKTTSENLSKVLYPNDKNQQGQELRLKQEYFFVSASVQDIVGRYMRTHDDVAGLPDKVAIQLNDTHPALAVPELMRVLIDEYGLTFDRAWDITQRTFSYTNHTLLPEALETWHIGMLEKVLPRHLELIFKINDVFLKQVKRIVPGDSGILGRVSLIDDGARAVRMAHLSIVGSHKVNGVADLHTKLLRANMFPDFDRLYPGKFVNMTNGITPRRWLRQANTDLAALICEAIGDSWIKRQDELAKLAPMADDAAFRERFRAIKKANKARLAGMIENRLGMAVDLESLFDTQVKRIHEYKRQLLNLFHVITRYNRLRENPDQDMLARTAIFAGKAAPGYDMAKLIVRLINDVADTINHDPTLEGRLKVLFYPDYNVSRAEVIIPGSDLSEQISTAGTEASGTGNMKFALNGALTIGTLDGANIEIRDAVGDDNIFIFGLDADGAHSLKARGYDPTEYYVADRELRAVLDMIRDGYFSPEDPGRYHGIVNALLQGGDHFLLLADYRAYVDCQERVDAAYGDAEDWTRRAILNVANMDRFFSDRTIHAYAREIWGIEPVTE
ncbi:MAG: glycogen/starch/alpha-glucan phosphorylase [Hyphomicrobiales bacterium]|nr:glycogen/starch/alpha-glucan phosphorylase [Hyphomicrobiales bacterium]MCP5371820.1 glycogen/starch/alpha-glucan phosphorylase [Hyphomicrobiales bacterium]